MTDSTKTTPNAPAGSTGGGRAVVILIAVVLIACGTLYILTRRGNTNQQQNPATTTAGKQSTDTGDGVAPPETAEVLLSAARNRLNAGQHAEAVTMLEAGIKKYPSDQAIHGVYAEALYSQGKKEEAFGAFLAALSMGENASYRDLAASIAYEMGRYNEAANNWALAQNTDPTNAKYPLSRAQALRQIGQHDDARVQLVIATKLDASLDKAWVGLAGIAMDAGNLDPALQHIERARRLRPTDEGYIRIESTIRRRLGQGQRAAELLLTISEPRRLADDGLLNELALCFGTLGEPERAVEMYERASKTRPNDANLYFELALWAQRVGDIELAYAASNQALVLGDQRAAALVEVLREELDA